MNSFYIQFTFIFFITPSFSKVFGISLDDNDQRANNKAQSLKFKEDLSD